VIQTTQGQTPAVGSTAQAPRAPKVRIHGLRKEFESRGRNVVALDGVSVDVGDGEFLVIVGPSGCGKTTLLRMVAGLEVPTGGSIEIERVAGSNRPANSLVFQEQSIFPWMTVTQNAEYGLACRGVKPDERRKTVEEYLSKVGLSQFADLYPSQLSGGMKQRVSIVRAFANDPEILLMDEPFAALDEQNRTLLQDELLRIWEETAKTVIYITHSIDEATVLADRIIVMTAHPGRVKAVLEVPFERPRSVYQVKADPRHGAFSKQIWDLLRDEVLGARDAEARSVGIGPGPRPGTAA
jgi:NitT/TauT family transport system ATP-binding protein